jgi:hypothetical protein
MRKPTESQTALRAKNTDKIITLLSNFFDQFSSKEAEQGLHQATQSLIAFGYEHNMDKANTAHLTREISHLLTALEKINNKVNKEAAVC